MKIEERQYEILLNVDEEDSTAEHDNHQTQDETGIDDKKLR